MEPQHTDGDLSFIGVDMRTDPQQLPPGYVSDAKNARFRSGRAEPRLGVWPLRFTFFNGFQWDCEWDEGDINWDKPIAIGNIYGTGVWSDPNGREWQLFVAQAIGDTKCTVWAGAQGTRVLRVPVSVDIPAPSSTRFPTTDQGSIDAFSFTSAFDRCVMHRADGAPLIMDDIGEGFAPVPEATSVDADVFSMPHGSFSLYLQNRLCVPYKPEGLFKSDSIAASGVLDYVNYSVFDSFRINQGDSDNIVGLSKFNDTTAIVFKESGIYSVSNLVGDWAENAVLDTITTEYGLVGRRTVVAAGRDLWFLSSRGVTSIVQTEQNKLQGTSEPISAPIQPLINRINYVAAKETAVAGYFKDRYYLAVPLDGSYRNNAVLVYDFLNKAWSGFDALSVKYFYVATQNGADALHYVDYAGNVGLYEYSEEDGAPIENQQNYSVDITIKSRPSDGSVLQVGGGDPIIIDASEIVNTSSPGEFRWGIGSQEQDLSGNIAIANLKAGFRDDGWPTGDSTVIQIDRGVRLQSRSPMIVSTDDPYIFISNSADQALEATPIEFEVTTRAYGYTGGGQGRFVNGIVHVSTWDPSYTVTTLTDGVFEESAWVNSDGEIAYIEKDRTKYLGFAIEDWDISNDSLTFSNPGREDYSVVLDTTAEGGGTALQPGGTALSHYQHTVNKFLTNRRGSYFQINIKNKQGRLRLHAAGTSRIQGERSLQQHGALH